MAEPQAIQTRDIHKGEDVSLSVGSLSHHSKSGVMQKIEKTTSETYGHCDSINPLREILGACEKWERRPKYTGTQHEAFQRSQAVNRDDILWGFPGLKWCRT